MADIILSNNYIKNIVKRALNEDLYPSGDVTSDLIQNSKITKFKLKIPMVEKKRSLNLSTSVAITISECLRQING